MSKMYSDKDIIHGAFDKLSRDYEDGVKYDDNFPLTIFIGEEYKVSISHEEGCLDLVLDRNKGSVKGLAEVLREKFADIDQRQSNLNQAKMLASRRVTQNESGDYVLRLQFKRELFRMQRKGREGLVGIVQTHAIYNDALKPLVEAVLQLEKKTT